MAAILFEIRRSKKNTRAQAYKQQYTARKEAEEMEFTSRKQAEG
jgi:hypothetical protein